METEIAIPLVSVVIPAYNKADFTTKAVESVLEQTYANIEIIAIDDNSTDDTYEKLTPYVKDNFILIRQSLNQGAAHSRNVGIKIAKGEYIAFLDCDDLYHPHKIEFCIANLEKNNVDFIYTPAYFIDKNDNIIKKYNPAKAPLLLRNYICNSTPVMKKEIFDEIGLFDEDFFICADWDMWLRIREKYSMYYFNNPLTYYRI
jgi:glycosyltransferase involved in cell wall biosynthesis